MMTIQEMADAIDHAGLTNGDAADALETLAERPDIVAQLFGHAWRPWSTRPTPSADPSIVISYLAWFPPRAYPGYAEVIYASTNWLRNERGSSVSDLSLQPTHWAPMVAGPST